MEPKTTQTQPPQKASGAQKVRLIWRFLRESFPVLAVSLLFFMLHTTLNSLTPQLIRTTVDGVLGQDQSQLPSWLAGLVQGETGAVLLRMACLVLAVSLLSGICAFLGRSGMARGSESFIKRMRDNLYGHIQRLPFSWHVQHQTGEIIQRCTSDVEVIRNFVCNQLMMVFRICFLVVLYMSIMFSMNVKISLVALCFLPLILIYSGIFYSRIAKRFLSADEAEGVLSSTVQENLTGVRVVRAFGRERFEIDRFDEKNNAFSNLWIRLGRLMSLYWSLSDLIIGLQILVVLCVGVVETVHGSITLGEFLVFVSYNSSLSWPVRSLGRVLSEMSKAGVSIDRVAYILNAQEEQEPAQALCPPMDRDICFEHVTYAYDGQKPVLEDVTFTIPAGSTFAVLGGTGSGKSTLVHLLNRLYDLPEGCGRITIGGVDIRQIRRDYLRKNIGMVLQEPFLFSRTIEENIGISVLAAGGQNPRREEFTREIHAAAATACVDEAIENFASGYDTVVGERGVTLSGGQKQRVAIARMLMQRSPVMVFDDSLSAVDSETDAKIRAALKDKMSQATVILISHRITTLMQADCIVVLDGGRVAEMGTHQQLLDRGGIYRDIYEIQMNSDDRSLLGLEE